MNDEKYIKRCIELAKQGLGNTYPNPLVGSVIVYDNKIIGEGYHQKCGQAHAEVNAVNSVKDKSLLQKSTLYVSLEPCAHIGRTPACSTMIINNKIPKVVIGTTDPFAKVAGKGIEMLKNARISVKTGVLEEECKELNKRFFTFHTKKQPYIILKWAQTKDGFIDIERNSQNKTGKWITNELARSLVHKWRSEEQSIMIGTDTAKLDNPQLNIRNYAGNNPVRICIDKDLRLNKNLHIFDKSIPTIIYTNKTVKSEKNLDFVKIDFSKETLHQILNDLYNKEIQSVIVEGGRKLLESFIQENLWDEARVFIGNIFFKKGVKAPIFDLSDSQKIMIDNSELYVLKRNPLIKNFS